MDELIEALLRLSRLTRGDMKRTPIDLSEIAQAAADELVQRDPCDKSNSSFTLN